MGMISAPWTPAQIHNLNAFQRSGRVHPFTCGRRSEHKNSEGEPDIFNGDVLVATEDGWKCPFPGCGYTQNWAHAFMANPLPPPAPDDLMAKARAANRAGRAALRAVAAVREQHQAYRSVYDTDGMSCSHCNIFAAPSGIIVPFPCDTIKAIDAAMAEDEL